MRQGCYELLVLRSDGTEFDESAIGEKTFVRAEAGQEYIVKFVVHRSASGAYPFAYGRCSLSVDGQKRDNGNFLNMDPSLSACCVHFRGFQVDTQTVQAFTFTNVTVSTDPNLCVANSKVGLLQVTVHEVELRQQPVNFTYVPIPVAPAVSTVFEEEKYWKRPSVATARGRDFQHHYNLIYARKMRRFPDATLEVQCHTAEVLDFLEDQRIKFYTRSSPIGVQIDLMDPHQGPPLLVDLTGASVTVTVMEPAPVPPAEEVAQKLQLQEHNELDGGNTAASRGNASTSRATDIPRTDHMQVQDEKMQAQDEAEESAQKMYKRKGQAKDEGIEQWVLVTVVHERPTKKAKKARTVGGADGNSNG